MHAALTAREQGRRPPGFVIPTGNLGNALACLLARQSGLPIGDVVLATNENRVLTDFLASGEYEPRDSVATLANAMDVGAPSNLERLRHAFARPQDIVRADWVSDDEIRSTVHSTFARTGEIVCPHTACGLAVRERLRRAGDDGDWIVAATAHAAKFAEVIEPLIGQPVSVPPALQQLLDRPARATPLTPSLDALAAVLASPT